MCLAYHHFARGEPREFGTQPGGRRGHHPKCAGRDVDPSQRRFAAYLVEGGEVVVAAGVEQAFLGQRAGGDKPHDTALHHRLGAALLRFRRVFHLFADGDAEALADQRQQIALGGMDGHAAHRNIVAQMLAALGERDIERFGSGLRIVEEQLVEIAHPVEQQRFGVARLDVEILRHHRRYRFASHDAPRIIVRARLGCPVMR